MAVRFPEQPPPERLPVNRRSQVQELLQRCQTRTAPAAASGSNAHSAAGTVQSPTLHLGRVHQSQMQDSEGSISPTSVRNLRTALRGQSPSAFRESACCFSSPFRDSIGSGSDVLNTVASPLRARMAGANPRSPSFASATERSSLFGRSPERRFSLVDVVAEMDREAFVPPPQPRAYASWPESCPDAEDAEEAAVSQIQDITCKAGRPALREESFVGETQQATANASTQPLGSAGTVISWAVSADSDEDAAAQVGPPPSATRLEELEELRRKRRVSTYLEDFQSRAATSDEGAIAEVAMPTRMMANEPAVASESAHLLAVTTATAAYKADLRRERARYLEAEDYWRRRDCKMVQEVHETVHRADVELIRRSAQLEEFERKLHVERRFLARERRELEALRRELLERRSNLAERERYMMQREFQLQVRERKLFEREALFHEIPEEPSAAAAAQEELPSEADQSSFFDLTQEEQPNEDEQQDREFPASTSTDEVRLSRWILAFAGIGLLPMLALAWKLRLTDSAHSSIPPHAFGSGTTYCLLSDCSRCNSSSQALTNSTRVALKRIAGATCPAPNIGRSVVAPIGVNGSSGKAIAAAATAVFSRASSSQNAVLGRASSSQSGGGDGPAPDDGSTNSTSRWPLKDLAIGASFGLATYALSGNPV